MGLITGLKKKKEFQNKLHSITDQNTFEFTRSFEKSSKTSNSFQYELEVGLQPGVFLFKGTAVDGLLSGWGI